MHTNQVDAMEAMLVDLDSVIIAGTGAGKLPSIRKYLVALTSV